MAEHIDFHYVNLLSNRLERFAIRSRSPLKAQFRCPVCGDSQKSKIKARGWILEKDNRLHFYCHNCGSSQSFLNFLKNIDSILYKDYVSEKFVSKVKDDSSNNSLTEVEFKQPTFDKNPLKKLKKISQLEPTHPIKRYVEKRQIPPHQHYRMYFSPKFKTWINSVIPGKFDVKKDEPRLVIPFLDKEGNVFGVSARGFDPNGIRYITIMFADRQKIFGLDAVDFSKTYFVVEGAIDCMFLSNAVAMAGADGNDSCLENLENAIFVFDAEPRNKEIHKRMEKVISKGHRICIWPKSVQGKDINEMILSGEKNIEKVIIENSFKGLIANLKLTEWRKT